jgi:hypothetical protein
VFSLIFNFPARLSFSLLLSTSVNVVLPPH